MWSTAVESLGGNAPILASPCRPARQPYLPPSLGLVFSLESTPGTPGTPGAHGYGIVLPGVPGVKLAVLGAGCVCAGDTEGKTRPRPFGPQRLPSGAAGIRTPVEATAGAIPKLPSVRRRRIGWGSGHEARSPGGQKHGRSYYLPEFTEAPLRNAASHVPVPSLVFHDLPDQERGGVSGSKRVRRHIVGSELQRELLGELNDRPGASGFCRYTAVLCPYRRRTASRTRCPAACRTRASRSPGVPVIPTPRILRLTLALATHPAASKLSRASILSIQEATFG